MTQIAASIDGLSTASVALTPSGVGSQLGSQAPTFGEPSTDAAMARFGQAWSTHMTDLDNLVSKASAILSIYAANFGHVGG